MNKLAIIITNYNMPERTDALVEALKERCDEKLFDMYVVDNGSDIAEQSTYTNVKLEKNQQTTAGWLAGYEKAKQKKYIGYVFTITSVEIDNKGLDIIAEIINAFEKNKDAVIISPALTADSTTTWTHMIKQGRKKVREVDMVDNLFCAYRVEWFDLHPFDPRFIYAWGTDFEQCYLAREENKKILLLQNVTIKKVTDIAYKMDRMNMTAQDRHYKATANMESGMVEKYGRNWRSIMIESWKDYD